MRFHCACGKTTVLLSHAVYTCFCRHSVKSAALRAPGSLESFSPNDSRPGSEVLQKQRLTSSLSCRLAALPPPRVCELCRENGALLLRCCESDSSALQRRINKHVWNAADGVSTRDGAFRCNKHVRIGMRAPMHSSARLAGTLFLMLQACLLDQTQKLIH